MSTTSNSNPSDNCTAAANTSNTSAANTCGSNGNTNSNRSISDNINNNSSSSSSTNSSSKANSSGSAGGSAARPKFATMHDMMKIVTVLSARPEAIPFRDPVNWKALGLFDYPKIIKKPMDLGTIRRRIEAGEYGSDVYSLASIEACAADIRLVWSNCMLYNQEGSDFHALASLFARKFDDIYAHLMKLHRGSGGDKSVAQGAANGSCGTAAAAVDVNSEPTPEQRLAASSDFFKLSNVEMGQVIATIEAAESAALSFKAGSGDEVILNFDALPPPAFHSIQRMISGFIAARKAQAKAAAAAAGADGGAGKKKRPLEETNTNSSSNRGGTDSVENGQGNADGGSGGNGSSDSGESGSKHLKLESSTDGAASAGLPAATGADGGSVAT